MQLVRVPLRARLVLVLTLFGCAEEPAIVAPPARAGEAPQARANDGPLVLFLGDSIAAGLHLAADEAYPAVVQRLLAEEGLPFRMINAGVSGDTTAGGLRRLDWLLRQDPDWVVIQLGANDGLRGVSLTSIESNLRAIVTKAQEADVQVLLLGIDLPPNYGPQYTAGFARVYHDVATDSEVAFLPRFLEGVGGEPELNLPDGIHPTPQGHRILAETVAEALRELLAEGSE